MKKKLMYFFFSFVFASCVTNSRLLFDERGAREVRNNIGRIEGLQQAIKATTDRIDFYNRNIEEGVTRERSLIDELTNIIRRIRERCDSTGEKAN